MSCRKTLDVAEWRSLLGWCRRFSRRFRNELEVMADSCLVSVPTGPLPEPAINGGMEEKVRFPSKYLQEIQDDLKV